jgi:predicted dehydrogenase
MAEAREIAAALTDYGGIAQMTFQNRFFPATIRARQLVEERLLGQVLEFRAAYLHSGSADPDAPLKWKLSGRHGGGVIADLGSHAMDLIQHLVGDFDELLAMTHVAYAERPSAHDPHVRIAVDAEDCVRMLVRTRSGAVGTIEASKIATGTEDELRFEIHGSLGAIRFNSMAPHYLDVYDARAPDRPVGGQRGWTRVECGQRYPSPAGFPGPKFSIGWIRTHMACLAHFLDSVVKGVPGEPSLAQGLKIQRLIACARVSAESKRWVQVAKVAL